MTHPSDPRLEQTGPESPEEDPAISTKESVEAQHPVLESQQYADIEFSIEEMDLSERDKHIIAAQKLRNDFSGVVGDRSQFTQPIEASVDQMVEMRAYLKEIKRHLDQCDGIDTEKIHDTRVRLLMAIHDVQGVEQMPVYEAYELRSVLADLCRENDRKISIERELDTPDVLEKTPRVTTETLNTIKPYSIDCKRC